MHRPSRAAEPVDAVIPWDAGTSRLLDAGTAQRAGYRYLSAWLKQAETLWAEHRRDSELSLVQQLDFYAKLSAQMPIASLRVIYSASGTIPAAAVLEDPGAVVEHKLYWAAVQSELEGRYLVAILNSEAVRKSIAPRQSRGQWGARDFDKLLADAVPQFDKNYQLHTEVAEVAKHAENIAAGVQLPERVYFGHARKLIRDALREDGVALRIEKLVARILDEGTP